MTRIVVPRGSSGASSSNPSRQTSLPGPSSVRPEPQLNPTPQVASAVQDEEVGEAASEHVSSEQVVECCGSAENKNEKSNEQVLGGLHGDHMESFSNEIVDCEFLVKEESAKVEELSKRLDRLKILDGAENEGTSSNYVQSLDGNLHPPPPPVPPPRPLSTSSSLLRSTIGSTNSPRVGPSRRAASRQVISTRTSPTGSHPSSPRSQGESEGYNSADEQNSGFISYNDLERERQFEIDLRRTKGLEVKKMLEDGNCLFRAVGDQVYGDSEAYDLVRQMCIDYMERERDHFSQFITEGFTSYCKRKRRDKVYGNNVEIQALSEMYNRPIHIYSYSTGGVCLKPINTFQGNYHTDTPPIRLSFHHGNHYNSLVNPRRLTIGAGLGFSTLRGANVDKDQVKAAIKAQQDQQLDKALIAEGQFYSDLELTEKEIERMVMEASRVEYLAGGDIRTRKQQQQQHHGGCGNSSTSGAEPSSSSGERASGSSESKVETAAGGGGGGHGLHEDGLSRSIQMVLSMGFSYLQAVEAYSIFGDDVDSMVCYLIETSNGSSNRRKGKATE